MRPGLLLAAVLAPMLAGCLGADGPALLLATTTSTKDTGLLDHLLPPFEAAHGAEVKVVAVGTGRALELGRRGDADVVLVHAPPTERAYLRNGSYGERREVMYNQFFLVGPPDDPAGLLGTADVLEAFRRLAEGRARFVSRGDQSGTHLREQELWAMAGVDPASVARPGNSWYLSVGQGMAATLRVAQEEAAYTLTDDGTFHALQPALAVVKQDEPPLRNQYSVLLRPEGALPAGKAVLAEALAAHLTGPEGQARIAGFEVRGHRLFTPNAGVVERA